MTNADEAILLQDLTADGSLRYFLETHLCSSLHPSAKDWKEAVLRQSPTLGPYILEGASQPPPRPDAVRLFIPTARSSTPMALRSWDSVLSNLAVPIAIVCSAGASRSFLELIKAWVEERKGREIRIKHGDSEVVIKGGVSDRDFERAVALFEKHFRRPPILKP